MAISNYSVQYVRPVTDCPMSINVGVSGERTFQRTCDVENEDFFALAYHNVDVVVEFIDASTVHCCYVHVWFVQVTMCGAPDALTRLGARNFLLLSHLLGSQNKYQ